VVLVLCWRIAALKQAILFIDGFQWMGSTPASFSNRKERLKVTKKKHLILSNMNASVCSS
jgi:hypothetical protein